MNIIGIKTKIIAILTAIVGFFVIKSKLQSSKIDDLEDKNKHLEKENTIEKAMDKAEEKAEFNIEKARSDFNDNEWHGKI